MGDALSDGLKLDLTDRAGRRGDWRKAYVRQIDCDYYTDAIDYTKLKVLDEADGATAGEFAVGHVGQRVGTEEHEHVDAAGARAVLDREAGGFEISTLGPEGDLHQAAVPAVPAAVPVAAAAPGWSRSGRRCR